MSYFAPCPCGGEVRVWSKADLRVCAACDHGNRRVLLILAKLINDFDIKTSEFLVRMSSFEAGLLK